MEIRDRITAPFFAQRNPGDDRRSRTWCDQRAQRPHGRGLARPVRAQEAEHLAVANLERDVVKSDAIPEALGQVLDDQRGLALRAIEDRGSADRFMATGNVRCRMRSHGHLTWLPERTSAPRRASTSSCLGRLAAQWAMVASSPICLQLSSLAPDASSVARIARR